MPEARANINVKCSTRLSGLIYEDEMICIPRTARYVVRNRVETAEDATSTSEHQRIMQYAIFRFNFEDEMVCIARTSRYVVRNQAETAEDAECTSEDQHIQQYEIFRFNF